MNSLFREKPLIPFLLTQILMLAFMGYFLTKEYEDERNEIVHKTQSDFSMKVWQDLEREPIKWVKDTSTQSGLKLIIIREEGDSHFIEDDVMDRVSTFVKTSINSDSFSSSKSFDALQNNTMLTGNDTTTSLLPLSIFDSSATSSISININGQFNQDNNSAQPILEVIDALGSHGAEITFTQVIKKMAPQILACLLLLILTFLTPYLFYDSLKKEKKLSSLRNDFMSNMSHELKTPVSTVSVALEALSSFNAADNKELRQEYIDISRKEIDRLNLLVDKALNLSLFEQGKFMYEKKIFNLDQEIATILKTLKVSFDTQKVNLDYNKIGNTFSINADRAHIVNVIHNLVENAVKYSQEAPKINILLKEKENYIQLEITDNGPGIPEVYHEKIFEKFFRVPQGNTHNTKGHGLGLSYVKEVLNKHNAKIKLESSLGSGTSFFVSFPKVTNHA